MKYDIHVDNILKEISKKLNINITIIADKYNETWRHFHTFDHILNILKYINEKNKKFICDSLVLAVLYHDIVYIPGADNNEEKSVDFFLKSVADNSEITETVKAEVSKLIMATKTHEAYDFYSNVLIEADMNILNGNLSELIEYEKQIFKEFKNYPLITYKEGRIDFLNKYKDKYKNLEKLIDYIEHREIKVGLYPGSFNPFHIGHLNILHKAEQIFDKVIIAKGINVLKQPNNIALPQSILNTNRCIEFSGLLSELISDLETTEGDITVIRGMRNSDDFNNEKSYQYYLKQLYSDVKIVNIICDDEFDQISSTVIKQLQHYGKGNKYIV